MSEEAKFSPTFNIQLFSAVMREILIFRMNQMAHVNSADHFWQAQQETVKLRSKLETVYKSTTQKAQMKHSFKTKMLPSEIITEPFSAIELPPDIWMFGAAAYDLITEQGMRLDAVLNMSGNKLAELAAKQGELFKAKAETDGDSVYLIPKKSREK